MRPLTVLYHGSAPGWPGRLCRAKMLQRVRCHLGSTTWGCRCLSPQDVLSAGQAMTDRRTAGETCWEPFSSVIADASYSSVARSTCATKFGSTISELITEISVEVY